MGDDVRGTKGAARAEERQNGDSPRESKRPSDALAFLFCPPVEPYPLTCVKDLVRPLIRTSITGDGGFLKVRAGDDEGKS